MNTFCNILQLLHHRPVPHTDSYQHSFLFNLVLYMGLGLITVGMIFVALGEGDKGFKSHHLKLFGPSMIILGFAISLIWVFILVFPSMMSLHPITRQVLVNKNKDKVDMLSGDRKSVPDIKVTVDTEDKDNNGHTNTAFTPDIPTLSALVENKGNELGQRMNYGVS